MAITSSTGYGFLYNLLMFYLALLVASRYSFCRLIVIFNEIMLWLSLASLFFFFLSLFFPNILEFAVMGVNKSGIEFYNFGVTTINSNVIYRNTGIFREPGVFMIYLAFALLNEILKRERSFFKIIIFLITLLTTLSTAGFLIVSLIFLVQVFYYFKLKNVMFLIMTQVCVYVILMFSPLISDMVFYKLTDTSSSSKIARIASITIPLEISSEYPLGCGPEKFNIYFEQKTLDKYGVILKASANSTNTYTKYFAVYGVIVGLLMLVASFLFSCQFSTSLLLGCIIFCIILLLFSNEDMRTSILFNMVIAYGLFWGNKCFSKIRLV